MNKFSALWAIIGGAIATFIMIRIWLPRPVPTMRYASVLLAGVIGGVVSGYLVHVGDSTPMPGIVAAVAGSLLFSGGVALLSKGIGNHAMV